jgi:hypothetical protein
MTAKTTKDLAINDLMTAMMATRILQGARLSWRYWALNVAESLTLSASILI